MAKKNVPSSKRPIGLRLSAVVGVRTAAVVTEPHKSTEQTIRNSERDMGFGGVRWVGGSP